MSQQVSLIPKNVRKKVRELVKVFSQFVELNDEGSNVDILIKKDRNIGVLGCDYELVLHIDNLNQELHYELYCEDENGFGNEDLESYIQIKITKHHENTVKIHMKYYGITHKQVIEVINELINLLKNILTHIQY